MRTTQRETKIFNWTFPGFSNSCVIMVYGKCCSNLISSHLSEEDRWVMVPTLRFAVVMYLQNQITFQAVSNYLEGFEFFTPLLAVSFYDDVYNFNKFRQLLAIFLTTIFKISSFHHNTRSVEVTKKKSWKEERIKIKQILHQQRFASPKKELAK